MSQSPLRSFPPSISVVDNPSHTSYSLQTCCLTFPFSFIFFIDLSSKTFLLFSLWKGSLSGFLRVGVSPSTLLLANGNDVVKGLRPSDTQVKPAPALEALSGCGSAQRRRREEGNRGARAHRKGPSNQGQSERRTLGRKQESLSGPLSLSFGLCQEGGAGPLETQASHGLYLGRQPPALLGEAPLPRTLALSISQGSLVGGRVRGPPPDWDTEGRLPCEELETHRKGPEGCRQPGLPRGLWAPGATRSPASP